MPNLRSRYMIPILIGALLLTGYVLLITPTKTKAQCGSQASSCKNCHEIQAQDPVNNDGTAWHTQHTQIDACVSCHAGNPQSTDKNQAHTGMVPWNSDVKAGCASCHPNNYTELAQQYATTLGVTIGESGLSATAVSSSTPITQTAVTTAGPCVQSGTTLAINDPNLVDFKQTYNEVVLGKKPVNWGNLILVGLIGLLVVGGGGFVLYNEKLVKVSFKETKAIQEEYPADIVEMLPDISKVSSRSRKTLSNMLKNPKKAEKVLGLIKEVTSDDISEDQP